MPNRARSLAILVVCLLVCALAFGQVATAPSRLVPEQPSTQQPVPRMSSEYLQVQERLARGWNTWDVHSVTTYVLLPEGLAIHVGMKHNATEGGDAFLPGALIGRLGPGAEEVTPGPHAWDGRYTDLRIAWHGHNWRIQSAHVGARAASSCWSPRCPLRLPLHCHPRSSSALISTGTPPACTFPVPIQLSFLRSTT